MRDVAIGSLLPTRTGTAILRGLHKRAHHNGHQPVTCRTQSIKDAMVGNMINPSIKATKPEVPMRKLVQAVANLEAFYPDQPPRSHRRNLTDRAELAFYLGQITKFGVYGSS